MGMTTIESPSHNLGETSITDSDCRCSILGLYAARDLTNWKKPVALAIPLLRRGLDCLWGKIRDKVIRTWIRCNSQQTS